MAPQYFRQSALVVSLIVTISFAIAKINPFLPNLNAFVMAFKFAQDLGLSWIFLTVFRNVKPNKIVRFALAFLPVICASVIICGCFLPGRVLSLGILFKWARCLTLALVLALLGMKQGCQGKLFPCFMTLIVLVSAWAILHLHSSALDFQAFLDNSWSDVSYHIHAKLTVLLISIIEAAMLWLTLSISVNEKLSVFTSCGWLKWGTIVCCIILPIFILSPYGTKHFTDLLDGVRGNIVLFRLGFRHDFTFLPEFYYFDFIVVGKYLPVMWYALFSIYRLVRKLIVKDIPWKAVIFDDFTRT